jgi:hypothetical protein
MPLDLEASPAPGSAHGPVRPELPGRNRRERPPARGGRPRAGPTARPPRVVAGILAPCRDLCPGHAQHGHVPATAVARLALGHRGHGLAPYDALIPLLASRTAELSPAPAPGPRHFAFGLFVEVYLTSRHFLSVDIAVFESTCRHKWPQFFISLTRGHTEKCPIRNFTDS